MLQAERKTKELVTIELVLPEGERFKLPHSGTGFRSGSEMEVTRLLWHVTESKNRSHPIDAHAVEDDGVNWTLSLRMSDVPLHVRSALVSACIEGDI